MNEVKHKWYSLSWENPQLPIVIALSIGLMWLINLSVFWIAPNNHGTFGDTFGAVNALFSGLAFVGIIYSIRLQQQELKNQQKEMEIQSKEFQKQNEVLKIQQFETSYLNLLNSHHSYVKELDARSWEGTVVSGKYIFTHINVKVRDFLAKPNSSGNYNSEIVNHFPSITMYITSLDLLLNFLERATLKEQDRLFYGSIIESQMHNEEHFFVTRFIMHYVSSSPYEKGMITRLKKYFLPDPFFAEQP